MNKYLIFGLLGLLTVVGLQSRRINKLNAENGRLDANQTALLGDMRKYKTSDSLNVASVDQLTLELKDYKKFRAKNLDTIEKLNVDIKRLRASTTSETKTVYRFRDRVIDSLVYVTEYKTDTFKIVHYQDDWLDFKGSISPLGDFSGKIESIDSLVYVEHVVPKKFLFFKFGVKSRRQEIISKNPHTEIVSSEFIRIKGK